MTLHHEFYEDFRNWTKVHTAFNDAELHLITGILKGEGFELRVKSQRVPQLPFSQGGLGATDIYVPLEDGPMAQRILMVYRNTDIASEG